MTERSTLLQSIRAQTAMELQLALRRGESVLLTLIVPPCCLPSWAVWDLFPELRSDLWDALVPGIATLAVISSAMVSLGIATAFERYYGVLKRLGSTPLPSLGADRRQNHRGAPA